MSEGGEHRQGRSGAGRRDGRFRQAAAPLRAALAECVAARGFAEPGVLLHWPEIVGADLAAQCRPAKVAYGRTPGLGATLVVETEGARATEIEHRAPQILERVNSHYGYRAVARLRIVQTGTAAAAGFAEAAAGFAGARVEPDGTVPTSAAAAAEAAALAAGIRDPRLRATLARLGALVLTRQRTAPE